jgi:RNA polymerase sigma factor (sigma-70 family)
VTRARLRSLPSRERTVLALRIDGFSTRETADHLGITEQQVRRLLTKARETLAGDPDKAKHGG